MPKTNAPIRKIYSVRLPENTIAQIKQLSPLFGGGANVVQIAVDRLYQSTIEKTKESEG